MLLILIIVYSVYIKQSWYLYWLPFTCSLIMTCLLPFKIKPLPVKKVKTGFFFSPLVYSSHTLLFRIEYVYTEKTGETYHRGERAAREVAYILCIWADTVIILKGMPIKLLSHTTMSSLLFTRKDNFQLILTLAAVTLSSLIFLPALYSKGIHISR